MRKILLYTLATFSYIVVSQELNEAYLASLPDSVRESVLESMSEQEKKNNTDYRRPSTMIYKVDRCKNLEYVYEDRLDFEESKSSNYLKSRPMYNSEQINMLDIYNDNECIERFGDEIFTMMQSSFMPINEPNFDGSYLLDFGDILELQLIGQKNKVEELPIKRDGSITIPDIGKVYISGLSLDTAVKMIVGKIKNALIGIEAYVSLVNVRDIQVLITGNAYNPGIYTLNGNSNVLHALSMAGGVDNKGSYRKIELIRNDQVIEVLDLYDVLINGKSAFGKRLRTGDSILVRPIENLVSIYGAVNRENSYELVDGETFIDLIKYANGFSNSVDKNNMRIQRLNGNEVISITVDENQLSKERVKDRDSLYIKSFVYKTVSLKGAVKNPGKYIIGENETLSNLIKKAEGYSNNAYPFGGILSNKKTKKINYEASERLYKNFIQSLITKGNALFASDMLPLVLQELKDTKLSGRVIAEFDLGVIARSPELDTTLEDGDEIIIPFRTEQVFVYGEVNNPGTSRYLPSQNVEEYIKSVGGILESGDRSNIYVVHPNGEVVSMQFGNFFNKKNNFQIYPGSVIYVPKVIKGEAAVTASIWAPIISGLSVSLASLSVLND